MSAAESAPTPTEPARRRRRRIPRLLGALLIACVLLAGGTWVAIEVAIARLGPPSLDIAARSSTVVLDREDRLLRAYTTPDGRWRLPAGVADVDPRYLRMLLAFEDKRFYRHQGVDPLAMLRAAGQLVRHGRIVSGGSTITMQVARLLEGGPSRSLGAKIRQLLRALQLERQLSKPEILRLYLTLAPFGGNIEGARAASFAYLGREPRRLSVGEAALLVALPQSPELRRPDRHHARAQRARDRVLARALAAGLISPEEARRARLEPVAPVRKTFPRLAAHLADGEVAADPQRAVILTTIDQRLQGELERLIAERVPTLGARLSAAILVVDHQTGEVLAHVGSAGLLEEQSFGAIDMTRVLRSPGSTLKPIIFALAFELGMAHPETLIEDVPTRFGPYAPKNFDDGFYGSVTLREALIRSLNIPAVKLLDALGPARLTARLRRAGVEPALPGKGEPSLPIALGGLGLKLTDLARLYAAIARGGEVVDLVHRREGGPRQPAVPKAARRLLSPAAAWYTADILKDAVPPTAARGGAIAYKTGTSYGYRDAWAIGFDGRHTVAVWVGRPDASATAGLTGHVAAAPLLWDTFRRIGERRAPLASAPAGVIHATNAGLPQPLRHFREASQNGSGAVFAEPAPQIAYPPHRAEIELEQGEPPVVVLKADGGALPLTWLVDGVPIETAAHSREVEWTPTGPGFVNFTVIDARGRADRVNVRLR